MYWLGSLVMTIPRYFNASTITNWRISCTVIKSLGSMVNNSDFSQFISSPEKLPNSSTILIAFNSDLLVSPQKSKISSAYSAILSSPVLLWKPIISELALIEIARGSKAQSRGDSGHPCLVPLSSSNQSVVITF